MDALALLNAAALVVVGVAAVAMREVRRGVVALVVASGLAVLVVAAVPTSPAVLAPAGAALVPLLGPVVVWGVLGGRGSAAVRVALIAGVVAGPVRVASYDAYFDPQCEASCTSNPLALVHASAAVHDLLGLFSYVGAMALSVYAVQSLVGRRPDRLPAAIVALAAWAIAVRPSDPLLFCTVIGLVALVVTAAVVSRAFEVRAQMTELARALEQAGDIEAALAAAVRDPGLRVTYVLDDGREVRPDGSTVADGIDATPTDLVGPDGVVARVHRTTPGVDAAQLADAVRGPGRLALENGRLAVQVSLQASELEASRRRLVVQADLERRRLERDLHDSAQQHVLALGLALTQALGEVDDAGDRDVLVRCLATTHTVLDELRELSHGFYPASLTHTGLRDALDGVLDRARVSVTVVELPTERLPAEVERALYLLTARAALTARQPVTLSIRRNVHDVVTEIHGAAPPDEVLVDVFAVLSGTLEVDVHGATSTIRGVLPIAEDGVAR